MTNACSHLDQVRDVEPRTPDGCEECLAAGTTWLHLRLCLTCGHVGCCDDSPNRHATKHFHATRHPIMRSFEPGEDWGWCYVDELLFDPAPKAPECQGVGDTFGQSSARTEGSMLIAGTPARPRRHRPATTDHPEETLDA
jgi:hypothetical protein